MERENMKNLKRISDEVCLFFLEGNDSIFFKKDEGMQPQRVKRDVQTLMWSAQRKIFLELDGEESNKWWLGLIRDI